MTAADIAYVIRKALATDEPAIQALARSERSNPNDLHYENFALAVRDDELIGATQIGRHPDGSLELGSLVVARDAPLRWRILAACPAMPVMSHVTLSCAPCH